MIDIFPQSRVPKLWDAELCRYIEHYAELGFKIRYRFVLLFVQYCALLPTIL